MILSDRDIKQYIESGSIRIDPFPDLDVALGSCSVDFRLGNTFMVFEHSSYSYIDPRQPQSIGEGMCTIEIGDEERFIMQAGRFRPQRQSRASNSNDLVARLEGRSSIARLGITVHSTAAVFEPGWVGTATMELSNLGRMAVALYPGMRICSFTFEQLSSPAEVPYRAKEGNKYAGQITLRGALSGEVSKLTRAELNGAE
ncbi:MAG: dCTP deaminase [Thermomicrobiales bacterium]